MDNELKQAIAYQLLTLGDDELILGHRNSEWTGHGPILEEDIAFTNIALDEIGHAATWYRLHAAVTGVDPDRTVFFRDAADYANAQMVELPNGDWAFSMLRQYLFDMYEWIVLASLSRSSYQPLADAAAKIRTEEMYHLRHTKNWVQRLALGTQESGQRMQAALDVLWPYTPQLFTPLAQEALLCEAAVVTPAADLAAAWWAPVTSQLADYGLHLPQGWAPWSGLRSEHTVHLATLLAEMQSVARLDPQADW